MSGWLGKPPLIGQHQLIDLDLKGLAPSCFYCLVPAFHDLAWSSDLNMVKCDGSYVLEAHESKHVMIFNNEDEVGELFDLHRYV